MHIVPLQQGEIQQLVAPRPLGGVQPAAAHHQLAALVVVGVLPPGGHGGRQGGLEGGIGYHPPGVQAAEVVGPAGVLLHHRKSL